MLLYIVSQAGEYLRFISESLFVSRLFYCDFLREYLK
nr:MAG TPA: hypothetical protein [Inoviridae sp.]